MSHDDASNAASASGHLSKRAKLTTSGTLMLRKFYSTVTTHPDANQKRDLLKKLVKLGNEHYTVEKVTSWFYQTRSKTWDPTWGSGTPAATQETSTSASTSASASASSNGRLTADGAAVLKHFYDDISRYPSAKEKLSLAREVVAIPGNDFYTVAKVNNWFAARRAKYPHEGDQGTTDHPTLPVVEEDDMDLGAGTSTGGVATPEPVSASTNRRLTSEGGAVLKNFFNNVARYPTTLEKQSLALQVAAIPGNEFYTLSKVNGWFNAYRGTHPGQGAQRDRTVARSTLSVEEERDLAVFLRETPNPSDALVAAWSRALRTTVPVVSEWIERQRVTSMPTPELDDMMGELDELTPSPSPEPEPPILNSVPMLTMDRPPEHISDDADLLFDLAQAMDTANELPSTQTLTREEFNALFTSYEITMHDLLTKVGSGQTDWHANTVPPNFRLN